MNVDDAIVILKNAAFLATKTKYQDVEEAIKTIIKSLEKQTLTKESDIIKNMDAIEYLTTKKRMCDENKYCQECLLLDICGTDHMRPQESVEIVSKWGKEHPMKTNADKFAEVFGKVMLGDMLDDNWLKKEYKEPDISEKNI